MRVLLKENEINIISFFKTRISDKNISLNKQ